MNYQITLFLNHLGSGTPLDLLTKLISSYYFLIPFWFLLFLAVFIFDRKNFARLFFILIIALIIHYLITELLFKHGIILFVTRPYLAHPGEIIQLGDAIKDSSFPSGHVASTAALSAVFVFFYRKTWFLAVIFTLLMAFARIHNGMHYLSDVLAGIVLGISYAFLARGIFDLIKQRFFAKM